MLLPWFLAALGSFLYQTAANHHVAGRKLSDTVQYYEELSYNLSDLLDQQLRVKRSPYEDAHLRWIFHAYGRDFIVLLRPDHTLFSNDFIAETQDGQIGIDTRLSYVGHVRGSVGSSVGGVLLKDGRFEGKISVEHEHFFLERAEIFFHQPQHSSLPFHSVIYKLSDVNMDVLENATGHGSDDIHEEMKKIAQEITVPGMQSFSAEELVHHGSLSRMKRQIDASKTTCEMFVQADYEFYRRWGGTTNSVVERITAHMNAVNMIYSTTDFDGNGNGDDIRFSIKRLKIWTNRTDPTYPFPDNYGVEMYLQRFSASGNFDAFCTAFTFTHRDFNDGTLGLAWTASLSATGGVCAKNGLYKGAHLSLNTGIVTTLNFQHDVVLAISQLTLAHELGHSMGSPHDEEADSRCAPGGDAGNYIMFPKATNGDKVNNKLFSPCSVASMAVIMEARSRTPDVSACFKVHSSGVCGNKMVEPGEQCDCGWDDECNDRCCFPMKPSYDITSYLPCTRNGSAKCSPSEGPCCQENCTVRTASESYACRAELACHLSATCDGSSSQCPSSHHKPNGTDCSNGNVCMNGECTSSVCAAFGLEVCQCSVAAADDWKDPKLCKLCCLDKDGVCKPSADIPTITRAATLTGGMPCHSYQGYCDVFGKCRKLDPIGPMNSLKKFITSDVGRQAISDWLVQNWYFILAGFIGFVLIMALFVRFCSKHHADGMLAKISRVHPSDQRGCVSVQHK